MNALKLTVATAMVATLSGCVTVQEATEKFQKINIERAEESRAIQTRLGTKQYQNVTKNAAIKAMAISFQRLDIIVDSSDYQTGLLVGRTKGVKPLSYDEFDVVKAIEAKRMEKYFGYSSFGDPSRIELVYNAFILEAADGVQISLRGRSDIKTLGNEVASAEFPPKWLEISYQKIWSEFEKNLFVQEKTLK